ncbi:MAG: hypothetical protein ACRDST_01105 [Pseudonocardiaceae bacterium]
MSDALSFTEIDGQHVELLPLVRFGRCSPPAAAAAVAATAAWVATVAPVAAASG